MKQKRIRHLVGGAALCTLALVPLAAVSAQKTSPAKTAVNDTVVATVNGHAIHASAVVASLKKVLGPRKVNQASLALLQAQILEQLINQHLVREHLQGTKSAASEQEVDRAIREFKAKLSEQNVSFDDLLKKGAVNVKQLRQQAAWELSWKNYLETHLTNKQLEAYFDAHRQSFDDSQIAASHILFRPATSGDPQQFVQVARQAQQVRQAIVEKKITFSEAALKYSQGPSRFQGGDLGFFPRQGVMEDAFAQAAFTLEVGQISQPVRTRFGIHLILCTKIRPGSKSWTDVREQLKGPASKELFQRLAREQREGKQIVYTNAMPHFQPGTQKIVVPRR